MLEIGKRREFLSPRYRWVYESADKGKALLLSQALSIPAVIAEILIKRGMSEPELVRGFFKSSLNSTIDPFIMKDMYKGANRLAAAVKKGEHICIYGDYDVDGITAASLMLLFLKTLGVNADYYIPNRLDEGYGLNINSIKEIAQKGTKLLITVDCGISAFEEAAYAASIGIDLIITDHHQAGDNIPTAQAVINPMRKDDPYPFKMLAGVGVAFKLCCAVRSVLRSDPEFNGELPNLKQFLDIVALGTVSDVMPLYGENRIMVVHGLKILSSSDVRVGIDELKKAAGIEKVQFSSTHIAFALAPRINAVGRLGDSYRGVDLLISTDRLKAQETAKQLNRENLFRQELENQLLNEIYEKIAKDGSFTSRRGLVLFSPKWHPGILGIAASRIAERYFKPTIILTEDDGLLKGSARSIPAFNLYEGLASISDLFLSFGGHKYAAGVKLKAERGEELIERFDAAVKSALKDEDFFPELYVDAVLPPREINAGFMDALAGLEPFGAANHQPIFITTGVKKLGKVAFVGKDDPKKHAKCTFQKDGVILSAIGYNMNFYRDILNTHDRFDILYNLSYNTYNNITKPQLVLRDLRVSL
ncbi:MAG: single-stranded-DNA-specific exonuclease RecJ [Deferribacteraceae bacterium]|jgi:single-stranded-DNA-specific exonuclease|nr:single-stranded-DNA-specific exonuclease RecJ [Deferribacteraceae bacterium]